MTTTYCGHTFRKYYIFAFLLFGTQSKYTAQLLIYKCKITNFGHKKGSWQ